MSIRAFLDLVGTVHRLIKEQKDAPKPEEAKPEEPKPEAKPATPKDAYDHLMDDDTV
jgi:hypothetical protein